MHRNDSILAICLLAGFLSLSTASTAVWAQEAPRLVFSSQQTALQVCDDFVVDVHLVVNDSAIAGYQLFLKYPKSHFEALRFEEADLSLTVLRAGFDADLAPCDDGNVWTDVVSVVASTVGEGGSVALPTKGEVLLGSFVFRPLGETSVEEGLFQLSEENCSFPLDQMTRIFDVEGADVTARIDFDVQASVSPDVGAPTSLACELDGDAVRLSWDLPPASVEAVRISRDGARLIDLPGNAVELTDILADGGGAIRYEVVFLVGGVEACQRAECSLLSGTFMRGDVDGGGTVNITDAVAILNYLFQAGAADCLDAADVNDDSQVNITDPRYLLNYLFLDGPLPPLPFPAAGQDETADTLGCARIGD